MINKERPCVAVMMSCYNGRKYIVEQIDSILSQSDVDIELFIRDDGSTDGTIEVLSYYDIKYSNIHVIFGGNVGVINSFFTLLYGISGFDYYAFADQDDVWLPEKIIRAINKLNLHKEPAMYFSKKIFVDEGLKRLSISDIDVRGTSIGMALLNGCAYGCTIVFNDDLHKLLCLYHPNVTKLSMHDAWVYHVAAAVGTVVYDKNSYILYRQHNGNVTSSNTKFLSDDIFKWKTRIKLLSRRKDESYRSDYAKEILNGYGNYMNRECYDIVYDFAHVRDSFASRMRLITSNKIATQKKYEIYFIKFFILLGWI